MVDRPIIFSAPMVRALLGGQKTQTRRLAKNRKHPDFGCDMTPAELSREKQHVIGDRAFPYGGPSDRLWVRETLQRANGDAVGYPADRTWLPNTPWQWQRRSIPSIHMPRWASRLTLLVEQVRVERLQDITEADAIAEGMEEPSLREMGGSLAQAAWSNRQIFSRLWGRLHGPDDWDANPWVVAISFRVVSANIDEDPAHAR